jgi:hypothetical protein
MKTNPKVENLIQAAMTLARVNQAIITAHACGDIDYINRNTGRRILAEEDYTKAYYEASNTEREEARLYTNAPIKEPI